MPGFQVSKGLPRPTQQADCPAPLLADVEDFYRSCNPDRENLCLYGAPPPTRLAAIQAWQLPVSCTKTLDASVQARPTAPGTSIYRQRRFLLSCLNPA